MEEDERGQLGVIDPEYENQYSNVILFHKNQGSLQCDKKVYWHVWQLKKGSFVGDA